MFLQIYFDEFLLVTEMRKIYVAQFASKYDEEKYVNI